MTFKDGSIYRGQVIGNGTETAILPHGYGELITSDHQFVVYSYFIQGKNCGRGLFLACSTNDRWYGTWNQNNRRHGTSIFIRGCDSAMIHEVYNDGIREKHLRKLPCKIGKLHWSTNQQCINVAGNSVPLSRSGHTCVNIDNKYLLLYGGIHDKYNLYTDNNIINDTVQCLNDLWKYDINTKQWTELCPTQQLPHLTGHTCTPISNNKLLFIGGLLDGDAVVMNSDICAYDVNTGKFSTVASKSIPFTDHCTVYCKSINRLFILVNSTLFELDLSTYQYTEVPTDYTAMRRARLCTGLIGATATYCQQLNQIIVIGGKLIDNHDNSDNINNNKQYARCSTHVRILDIHSMTWLLPDVKHQATHGNTTSVSTSCKQVTRGDYSGVSQLSSGGSHIGRYYHTANLINDQYIYVYGGVTTQNPSYNVVDTCYLNDIQIYDCINAIWLFCEFDTLLQPLPSAQHTAVLISNELYVYGGKNCCTESLDQWYMLYTLNSTHTDKHVPPAPKIQPLHTNKSVVKPNVSSTNNTIRTTERRKVVLPDRRNIDESKQNDDVDEYVEPVIDNTAPVVGSGSILDMFKANINM